MVAPLRPVMGADAASPRRPRRPRPTQPRCRGGAARGAHPPPRGSSAGGLRWAGGAWLRARGLARSHPGVRARVNWPARCPLVCRPSCSPIRWFSPVHPGHRPARWLQPLLLALRVHWRDRRRRLVVAGCLVLSSGVVDFTLVYFAGHCRCREAGDLRPHASGDAGPLAAAGPGGGAAAGPRLAVLSALRCAWRSEHAQEMPSPASIAAIRASARARGSGPAAANRRFTSPRHPGRHPCLCPSCRRGRPPVH